MSIFIDTPPDCTLTTSFYDLTKYHDGSRKFNEAIQNMKTLLEVPCYLVIYTDNECFKEIQKIRNSYGLEHLTKYILQEFEELHYYSYINVIKNNRTAYWPTRDERTCAENHLLVNNKINFLKKTIELNPFQTTKFGWIDANIGPNFSKIAENYNKDMLIDILRCVDEKLHIQILNVTNKEYKRKEHKRAFYEYYR